MIRQRSFLQSPDSDRCGSQQPPDCAGMVRVTDVAVQGNAGRYQGDFRIRCATVTSLHLATVRRHVSARLHRMGAGTQPQTPWCRGRSSGRIRWRSGRCGTRFPPSEQHHPPARKRWVGSRSASRTLDHAECVPSSTWESAFTQVGRLSSPVCKTAACRIQSPRRTVTDWDDPMAAMKDALYVRRPGRRELLGNGLADKVSLRLSGLLYTLRADHEHVQRRVGHEAICALGDRQEHRREPAIRQFPQRSLPVHSELCPGLSSTCEHAREVGEEDHAGGPLLGVVVGAAKNLDCGPAQRVSRDRARSAGNGGLG